MNTIARNYPIESLLDVANGSSNISISHARKLIAEDLITKSYEKENEGPGRPLLNSKFRKILWKV